MSDSVQITLIVCVTIIICYAMDIFGKKEEKLNQIIPLGTKGTSRLDEIFDRNRGIIKCKSPTHSRPPRPGYQPKYDNSELKIMRKPPSQGSGIK